MATQRRRPPTDVTGAKRDQLQREHQQEIERRQNEIGMISAQQKAASDEVVDLVNPGAPGAVETAAEPGERVWEAVGEPVVVGGDDGDGTVVIRTNMDLDDVTVGAGTSYTFKEGQRTRVPRQVAAHLEEKGYVAH